MVKSTKFGQLFKFWEQIRSLVKNLKFCKLKIIFFTLHLKAENQLADASIKKQQSKIIPLKSVFGGESEYSIFFLRKNP